MTSKNRVTFFMIALLIAIGQAPRLAHAGTGGGNGDPTGTEQRTEMQNDFGADVQLVTTSTDPARRAQELSELKSHAEPMLDHWCDQIVSFLAKYLHRANIQTQKLRFGRANQIMEDAISVAIQKIELDPNLASPQTLRLLKRGEAMAAMLDQQIPASDYQGTNTKYEFLKDYLQFVIDQSNSLDRKLVIPYFYTFHECKGGCPTGFSMDDFERQYLETAQKQLEFPLRFTHTKPRDGETVYVSVGNEKVFLNLAQMVADGVAKDIKATLSRYAEACTVRDLLDLSHTLIGANQYGNDGDFVDLGEEIDTVAKRLVSYGKRLADGECRAAERK